MGLYGDAANCYPFDCSTHTKAVPLHVSMGHCNLAIPSVSPAWHCEGGLQCTVTPGLAKHDVSHALPPPLPRGGGGRA
jgi:hypothetical protein